MSERIGAGPVPDKDQEMENGRTKSIFDPRIFSRVCQIGKLNQTRPSITSMVRGQISQRKQAAMSPSALRKPAPQPRPNVRPSAEIFRAAIEQALADGDIAACFL